MKLLKEVITHSLIVTPTQPNIHVQQPKNKSKHRWSKESCKQDWKIIFL